MTQSSDTNTTHLTDLPRPIGLVCHDAGGADQLASHIHVCLRTELAVDDVLLFATGPAVGIFESRGISIPVASTLDDLVDNVLTLVSGTGWSSNIEHEGRQLAASARRYSVSILDNWSNYKERFERDGVVQLPDEIWVVDNLARGLAELAFPNTAVRLIPDLRTEQIIAKIASAEPPRKTEILYIAEPVRPFGLPDPSLDKIAFRYFLDRLGSIAVPSAQAIRLRLHPAQDPHTFDDLVDSAEREVIIDRLEVHESIARASFVVGMNSSLLVIAQLAGRRVFTAIPPGFPERSLPHEGMTVI